jgi:hypothetical protein
MAKVHQRAATDGRGDDLQVTLCRRSLVFVLGLELINGIPSAGEI